MADIKPFKLVKWPDPRLREVALPLLLETREHRVAVHKLIDRMWITLEQYLGYGLAAPQIGYEGRIILIRTPSHKFELINPELETLPRYGKFISDEGCLSYPGRRVRVSRWRRVKVRGLDRHGDPATFGGKDLQAAAIQHECEHLDGINLADYDVSSEKPRG